MATLKRVLRTAVKTFLGIVSFLLLYAAIGFICGKIIIDKESNAAQDVAIYIKTNGVHTDIVVPARSPQMDWTKDFKYANTALKDTTWNYLALGWGDKGFYLTTPTWADLRFSTAFKAAFALSPSAIHATYYRSMPENEHCKKIWISKDQYDRLIHFIFTSIERGPDGRSIYIPTHANYSISDAFYEANGRYNLFYTCNTWSNNALGSCGQRHCLWALLDKDIFNCYK